MTSEHNATAQPKPEPTAYRSLPALRMGIDVMPPKDTEEPHKPRLLHESLNQIPQGPRFGISGALCNVIFIAGFNACVEAFESPDMPASRIYSLFYCAYIPVGHAINSLLVFGWPEKYLPSLMSNAPIGLTAMMLGTILTGYFDRIGFEHIADQFLINIGVLSEPEPDEERSEFYSSIAVMIITGVWSYLLSVWVNAAPSKKKPEGKEL